MNYKITTLNLPDDYEGKVTATLVNASCPDSHSRQAVLYLHGYIDYFFQDHEARKFCEAGYNFYALDLRKYGRSLLPHQHPDYCRSLNEYYPEITAALQQIQREGNQRIVLIGHSTGGLLAALYAAEGAEKNRIDALVLNSPFLAFNTSPLKRNLLIPCVGALAAVIPFGHKANELSPFYAPSIHCNYRGEWSFDEKWKPIDGIPLYFAWLRAIRRGQRRVRRGLNLSIPVLVLSSDRSSWPTVWNEQVFSTDVVLNVADIRRLSSRLGSHVTYSPIVGGIHDLALSREIPREAFFNTLFTWLEENRTH